MKNNSRFLKFYEYSIFASYCAGKKGSARATSRPSGRARLLHKTATILLSMLAHKIEVNIAH